MAIELHWVCAFIEYARVTIAVASCHAWTSLRHGDRALYCDINNCTYVTNLLHVKLVGKAVIYVLTSCLLLIERLN